MERVGQQIKHEKINEMIAIHRATFNHFIKKSILDIKLKKGVMRYYNNYINENNIEIYYNMPMNLFFNELYKTTNNPA